MLWEAEWLRSKADHPEILELAQAFRLPTIRRSLEQPFHCCCERKSSRVRQNLHLLTSCGAAWGFCRTVAPSGSHELLKNPVRHLL